jgi:hypothetical protein
MDAFVTQVLDELNPGAFVLDDDLVGLKPARVSDDRAFEIGVVETPAEDCPFRKP